MGIIEEVVKDRPTKTEVTKQLETLEIKINGKMSAYTLKSESAEAIAYCAKKIKLEKDEEEAERQPFF